MHLPLAVVRTRVRHAVMVCSDLHDVSCLLPHPFNSPMPCENGGRCEVGADGMTPFCDCPPGFTGATCAVHIAPDSPGCECVHGSSCAGGQCNCTTGWRGSRCDVPVCPGYVAGATSNCNSNGVCASDGNRVPACQCAAGWSGADCSVRVCDADFCSNGGTCSVSAVTGTDPKCSCTSGFQGERCSVSRMQSGTLESWETALIVVGCVVAGVLVAAMVAATARRASLKRQAAMKKDFLDQSTPYHKM